MYVLRAGNPPWEDASAKTSVSPHATVTTMIPAANAQTSFPSRTPSTNAVATTTSLKHGTILVSHARNPERKNGPIFVVRTDHPLRPEFARNSQNFAETVSVWTSETHTDANAKKDMNTTTIFLSVKMLTNAWMKISALKTPNARTCPVHTDVLARKDLSLMRALTPALMSMNVPKSVLVPTVVAPTDVVDSCATATKVSCLSMMARPVKTLTSANAIHADKVSATTPTEVSRVPVTPDTSRLTMATA